MYRKQGTDDHTRIREADELSPNVSVSIAPGKSIVVYTPPLRKKP